MSGFAEISDGLGAARQAASELSTRMNHVHTFAVDLADRADSHGWTGIAGSMREAAQALGTAVAELVEVQQASESASAQVELIDGQGSAVQVSAQLSGAQQEITVVNADPTLTPWVPFES